MDDQDALADEERVKRSALQMIVGGISLELDRDEEEINELAFVERCRAQVDFQLSDLSGDRAIIDELSYYIQILAYNLETGRTEVLAADHQRLHVGQSTYAPKVEFATPTIGRYKLLGTVLLPDGNAAGVALGPVLHIVSE